MRKWALLCGVMLLFAGIASAQDDSKVTLFGGYSYVRADADLLGTDGSANLNGGSGSIAYKVFPMVSLVADFGGYHWSGSGFLAGSDATAVSYMFGPKVSTHVGPLEPFVQTLFGGTHVSATFECDDTVLADVHREGDGGGGGGFCGSGSSNTFSMTAGGGVDWNATTHLGVRLVQAEYYMTRFGSVTQNNLRLSAGVTFRF